MSNPVPDGWSLQPLSALANYYNGRAFKPEDWSGEGLPIIRIAQINNRNADLDYYAGDDVSDKNYIRNGDLLFSWSATLTALLWDRGDAVLNQHIFKVEEKDGIDRLFLHQLILNSIDPLAELSHGSTMKHIKKGVLDEYCVETPPLPEQQKIAAILSTVDDVIEKTRAQIDKLKDLKTGMMQELLTKGIGPGGVPHTEFKDSPVGRIPVGWDTELLDNVAKRGSGHTPDKSKGEYWNGGIKWISLSDSDRLDKLYISESQKQISDLGIKNSSAVLHPAGIVVMSRDAGIGKSAITTCPMAVSQHFMAWNCGSRLDNHYLYYLLQYWKPKFEAIAIGSTIKTIGLPYFKKLLVPVPPIEEQHKIAASLKSVDSAVFELQKKEASIVKVKKALMQDLLTGKVRVKVDNKESAVA